MDKLASILIRSDEMKQKGNKYSVPINLLYEKSRHSMGTLTSILIWFYGTN
jgi:hypothetical protein